MENLEYKYIVYKTTNLVNGKIYIGVHKTLTPYEFDGYLGNGFHINHRLSKSVKTIFANAIRKYGYKNFHRETLAVFDTLEEAFDLEREIVNEDFVKRTDNYNIAIGGQGCNISLKKKCYQYNIYGEYINGFNSIADAANSLNINRKWISNSINKKVLGGGFYWSDEYYEQLDLSKIHTKRKIVYQYSRDGEYETRYPSVKDAAKAICDRDTNILFSIKKKTLVKNKFFSFEKVEKYEVKDYYKLIARKVYQYDLNGNFLCEYNNRREVYEKYHKSIPLEFKRSNTCFGYQWSYEKVDKMENRTKGYSDAKPKKVFQYTLNGDLIAIYNKIVDCEKIFPNVKKVLYGKQKTTGGFIFKCLD